MVRLSTEGVCGAYLILRMTKSFGYALPRVRRLLERVRRYVGPRSAYILMMLGDKPYLPCHLKSSPCFSRANSGHRGVFTPVTGTGLVQPFCLTLYTYLADVKMLTCITCTYLYIYNTLTFTRTYTAFYASCVRRGVFFLPRIVQVCMIQVVSV